MTMNRFQTKLTSTCAAFVVRNARNRHMNVGYPIASRGIDALYAPPKIALPTRGDDFFPSTRAFSTFKPADPPGTHGTPVFPDIDFSASANSSTKSAASFQRNSDPNAVFVVTGANRGIGLQFVKSLIARTKVRRPQSASSYSYIR